MNRRYQPAARRKVASGAGRSGGAATRTALIESHLPLVRAIARRYAGRGEPLDDLVQAGALALVKAADRFDPARGPAFASFAAPAIEGEIRRHLAEHATSVRIPRQAQRLGAALDRCRAQLGMELGRTPTRLELARALGVEETDVEQVLQATRAREVLPLAPADELAPAAEPLARTEERVVLERSTRVLGRRERRILFLRFHADMTEAEIARVLGLSQGHVSRLLTAALVTLRGELSTAIDPDITGDTAISRRPKTPTADHDGSAPTPASTPSAPSQKVPSAAQRETRIARVGATGHRAELERYLDLPYHVTVRSDGDAEGPRWTAAVEELPGCEAQGETPDDAVGRVREAMETWLSRALRTGRRIPGPNPEPGKRKPAPAYSGRILVRMPASLHEQLTLAAERAQVSLNRFVTETLASAVSGSAVATVSESAAAGGAPQAAANGSSVAETVPDAPHAGTESSRRIAMRLTLVTNLVVLVLAAVAAVVLLVVALGHDV